MDRIRLNEMVFYGYHGVRPEERALGQRFVVSVELCLDLKEAGLTDDLSRTVNYSEVFAAAREVVTGPPCMLIETVAERIAARLLAEHEAVTAVAVNVKKPAAPIAEAVLGSVEVSIERRRADGTI